MIFQNTLPSFTFIIAQQNYSIRYFCVVNNNKSCQKYVCNKCPSRRSSMCTLILGPHLISNHISNLSHTCFMHIHELRHIRQMLDFLQLIQNSLARAVTRIPKHHCITGVAMVKCVYFHFHLSLNHSIGLKSLNAFISKFSFYLIMCNSPSPGIFTKSSFFSI